MKTTTILLWVLWPLATLGDLDGTRPFQQSLHKKRAEFDARVSQWLRENPQHSFLPEDTTVEDLWERLQDADRQSARGFVSTDPDPPASETRLRPRKIATAQAIDEAETILNSAIFEAEKRASAKPKHNHYTLRRPNSSGQAPSGIDTARFDAEQDKILQAAAILAEADAANSTDEAIFKEYTIAYRESLDGPVKHRVHSPGRLKARADYWLAELGTRNPGSNPFGSANAGYKVFRNVKDYGAQGDGKKDDTEAINRAISDQNRCGANCGSSTVKGATVYFPPGRYLVSGSIFALYHTQLVGHPTDLPVLVAARRFSTSDLGVIAANKYTGVYNDRWKGDDEWYLNTANFFRQVRNFIIDIRDAVPANMKGMHWQVAQATSLQNVHFKMKPGSKQVGLFIENGSGGLLSDLTFEGGGSGMECGNQQFTSRNLIFEGCKTAITMLWDWGWVWQGIYVAGADVGINFTTEDFPGGSITVLDSTFSSVKTAIVFNTAPKKSPKQASLGLINVEYKDVGDMVFTGDSATGLRGGNGLLASWFIGNTFSDVGQGDGASGSPSLNSQKDAFVAGTPGGLRLNPNIPSGLRRPGKAGHIFARPKPQYESLEGFVVPTARGDGKSDSTAALNLAFRLAAEEKRPVFLPAGSYIVTDTVFIPKGSVIIGMCWSQIVASGKRFEDMAYPRPMVKVGNPGDEGSVEISDLLFTSRGPTAGLVAMEWNIKSSLLGNAAMWDSHFRIGGAAGTNLQVANCPRLSGAVRPACIAGSLLLHLTKTSSAYLENIWAWTADHDLDDKPSLSEAQVDIYVARGILIESKAPTWLYATSSEHNILYQYQLHKADNVFMGLIQTESPYFHPEPTAPKPFESSLGKFPGDPTFEDCTADNCKVSWALSIIQSRNVHIVGAGLYSWFFDKYDQGCIEKMSCQTRLVNIDFSSSSLYIYNLFTVGTKEMISMDMRDSIMAKDNQMLADRSPWTSIIAAFVKSAPSRAIISGTALSAFANDERWFPKQCRGLDTCWEDTGSSDATINDDMRKATKHKGYLCLIDAAIAQCRIDRPNYSWNACFYAKLERKPGFSCATLGDISICPAPERSCDAYADASMYWALYVLNRFAVDANNIRTMAFFSAQELFLAEVEKISEAIGKMEPEEMELKKIFKIVAQVLSFLGFASGQNPVAGPINLLSMGFDAAQEHFKEPKRKEEAMKSNMTDFLGTYITVTREAMEARIHDFFVGPNMSHWKPEYFPGKQNWVYGNGSYTGELKSDVTRYLSDGRHISHYETTAAFPLTNTGMRRLMKLGLTFAALSDKRWYILRDALAMVDCHDDKNPGAVDIDGHCYALHHLGEGQTGVTITDSAHFTVPASRAIVDLLGIDDVKEVIKGSIQCQSKSSVKYAESGVPVGDVNYFTTSNTGEPLMGECFFNLPVLHVKQKTQNSPTDSSPCLIFQRSKKGGSPVAGENILPPSLVEVVNDRFCQILCRGKDCVQETVCKGCESVPPGKNMTAVAFVV